MLLEFFYNIIQKNILDTFHFSYTIIFNSDSEIYKAHFPSKPITPGACLLEISRELLEDHFKTNFLIYEVKTIKYLQLLEPTIVPTVSFHFDIVKEENQILKINVKIADLETIFTKLTVSLTKNE